MQKTLTIQDGRHGKGWIALKSPFGSIFRHQAIMSSSRTLALLETLL
jgi:hypothetical protein